LARLLSGTAILIYVGAPTSADTAAGLFPAEHVIKNIGEQGRFAHHGLLQFRNAYSRTAEADRDERVLTKLNSAFEGQMDTLNPGFAVKLMLGERVSSSMSLSEGDPWKEPTIIPASVNPSRNYRNRISCTRTSRIVHPSTTISFDLPEQALVTLKVYNMLGQEVGTLIDHQLMDDGTQEFQFNGASLASGVYFLPHSSLREWMRTA